MKNLILLVTLLFFCISLKAQDALKFSYTPTQMNWMDAPGKPADNSTFNIKKPFKISFADNHFTAAFEGETPELDVDIKRVVNNGTDAAKGYNYFTLEYEHNGATRIILVTELRHYDSNSLVAVYLPQYHDYGWIKSYILYT